MIDHNNPLEVASVEEALSPTHSIDTPNDLRDQEVIGITSQGVFVLEQSREQVTNPVIESTPSAMVKS